MQTRVHSSALQTINFRLSPQPPFRLDLAVWILRRRAQNAIDRWDGVAYRRVLVVEGRPVQVAMSQVPPRASRSHAGRKFGSIAKPLLYVSVTGRGIDRQLRRPVTDVLDRTLGLSADLGRFYRFAASQPQLCLLARRFRGMKPPRYPSLFETLVNAIACQQITLTLGITMLNRLAEACGYPWQAGDEVAYAFPRPEDIARLDPYILRSMGFSRQKARAIVELARAVMHGQYDLDSLAELDDQQAVARLQELHGVGRWTAEYVLLRGLGRLHVIPGDDAGLSGSLANWLHIRKALDYEGVRRTLEPWKEYAGLVYFHLLLNRLAQAGVVR